MSGQHRRIWVAVAGSIVGAALLAVIAVVAVVERGGPPDLTWLALRNASYSSQYPRDKIARLSNGLYEEVYIPGSATKLTIRMADFGAFGHLDDDSALDAVVILIADPGGSGTFVDMVPVLNSNGTPQPSKPVLLGDRIAVRALNIRDHRISVRMRVRGPTDPYVKLSREVTRVYAFTGEGLVLESESTEDVPSRPPDFFIHEPRRIELPVQGGGLSAEGTLRPGGIDDYVVRLEAGQEVKVAVRSEFGNAIMSFFGLADETQLVSRAEYATVWSGRTPTSQDYALKIITVAGYDLHYTFSIEVQSAPTAPFPTSTRVTPPPSTHVPVATPTAIATRPPGTTPTLMPTVAATRTPVPSARPITTPSPTVAASTQGGIPLLWRGIPKLTEHPISELSPEAAEFAESRDLPWGVAVVLPASGEICVANADSPFETASVVKVLVMLAVLDRATQEHRFVGEDELELLWPMITESDNDSTTQLWNQVGGGRTIKAYLARIGASGITPYDGAYWGLSVASARGMSLVMARLAFGDLLDDASRKLALNLLLNVIPGQRWGISAGTEGEKGHVDSVGLKNGWYPVEGEGWRVNSTGFIVSPLDSQPAYVITIMSNQQTSWDYGIDTIAGTASRVHDMLHSRGGQ